MFPSFSHPDAASWTERAEELAAFVMRNLVNRTDVWGAYVDPDRRSARWPKTYTAPRKAERGSRRLTLNELSDHFCSRSVIGLHAQSDGVNGDQSSLWLGFDIDAHGDVAAEISAENMDTAMKLCAMLTAAGAIPLLEQSCSRGGLHVWVRFSRPVPTKHVHRWGCEILHMAGVRAEVFPKQSTSRFGNWLRLPGPHHTQQYYSKFSSEPDAESSIAAFLGWPATLASLVPVVDSQIRESVVERGASKVFHKGRPILSRMVTLSAYIRALPTGMRDGQGRNDTAYKLAARVLAERGRAEALVLVSAWNQTHAEPLPEGQVRIIVDNAARYARGAHGG